MKRISFLAALFGIGVAKAQRPGWRKSKDYSNCHEHEDGVSMACSGFSDRAPVGGRPKPANGECPVCGTMAESLNLKYSIVTCAHCGVLFKQEAEK